MNTDSHHDFVTPSALRVIGSNIIDDILFFIAIYPLTLVFNTRTGLSVLHVCHNHQKSLATKCHSNQDVKCRKSYRKHSLQWMW